MTPPNTSFHWISITIAVFGITSGCSGRDASSNQDTSPNSTSMSDQGSDTPDGLASTDMASAEPVRVRVATFNASLYRRAEGALRDGLAGGTDAQAHNVARVLQHIRPDVVLINEFDWDAGGVSAQLFHDLYLAVPHEELTALSYAYRYVPTTNTGEHSGVDLNNSGSAVSTPGSQAYGDDAFGFGQFPGQYGMVIYSRYPIQTDALRTFRLLRWSTMPDTLMPTDWYSGEAVEVMRLSSKNHVDVPIDVEGRALHLLASHPTPPSFDGPEDRNGRRNHDEIRLWRDYIGGGEAASYIVDDAGRAGALAADAAFVIVGDLNSDPLDGDSVKAGINELLNHPRVQDTQPRSEGGVAKAALDGQANVNHQGDPALDTADFSDRAVGNLRVDYALPSSNVTVLESGVFWPTADDPLAALTAVSDHHLVWVDLEL